MPLSGGPIDRIVPMSDLLRAGLERKPDEVALVSLLSRFTWRELDQAADRLARHLLSMGLSSGERVAALMPNRTALLIFYLSCFRAGLVCVPLNYRCVTHEIEHHLQISGASLLFHHAERDADIGGLGDGLAHGTLSYDAQDGRTPSYEALMASDAPDVALPNRDPEAPAFLFFTSGSTGPAKGVVHCDRSLAAMLAGNAQAFGLMDQDIVLPASSMAHLGAFFLSLAALSVGAKLVLARSTLPEDLRPLFREQRPSVLMMLQTALFGVVRNPGIGREDLASLRLCRCGGDKVSDRLQREFRDLTGLTIREGLGITEGGQIAFNRAGGQVKPGSIGRPLPGVEISVRDAEGQEVPAGTVGRMWVRSPSIMAGYWQDPEATAEVIRDGWFYTGDLVEADVDGFLWFRGRQKQVIVHNALNITPQEVEEALLEHEAVAAAGVVGVKDPLYGENVLAFVALTKGANATAQELIDFARERIGYKAPEEIAFLETMPRNPTGKIDRVALKALAETRAHD